MPILRFDLIEGRDEKSVTQLLDAAHDAVVKALGVPGLRATATRSCISTRRTN
jgi:hypothetical protein